MTTTSRLRPGLRLADIKQALTLFNWNVGLRSVYDYVCMVTGFLFIDYALSLGISKEMTGLFPAFVNLGGVLQLASLWIYNDVRRRKAFTLSLCYLEIIFTALAIIAGLFVPPQARLPVLAGLILLGVAASSLTRPTMDAWLASSIPERLRGRYLGIRYMVMSAVGAVGIYGIGTLAQRIPRNDTAGFALLLLVGCLFGATAIFFLHRIPMPHAENADAFHWRDLVDVLRNRPYIRFVLGMLIYEIPFFIGPVYYQVFYLRVLYMKESVISLVMVGYLAVKILLSPLFGRLVDRLGVRRLTLLVTPSYMLTFLGYMFCGPRNAWLIFILWALAGVGDGAFGVILYSALYATTPDTAKRQAFFAFYNLVMLLGTSIGAFAAVAIAEWLKDKSVTVGPFVLGQFHLLYAGCFVYFIFIFLFSIPLMPGKGERV